MALRSPLTVQPYDYIADSNGRPLDYGQVYIGVANQDPEFYQIPVYLDAAMTKPIDQPIRTNDGFVDFAGSLSELYASAEVYSVKVLDKQGRKVLYKGDMTRKNLMSDALADLNQSIVDAQSAAQAAIDATVNNASIVITNVSTGATAAIDNAVLISNDAASRADSAIQDLFESGGLPATPFSTYAKMTAPDVDPPLVDGDYAVVINDADLAKNGFYEKIAGAWVFLKWNPLSQSKAYIDGKPTYVIESNTFDGANLYVSTNDVSNFYVNIQGYIGASSGTKLSMLPVGAGDGYLFKVTATDNQIAVAFSDSNVIAANRSVSVASVIKVGSDIRKIIVPSGAKYMFFNTVLPSSSYNVTASLILNKKTVTLVSYNNATIADSTARISIADSVKKQDFSESNVAPNLAAVADNMGFYVGAAGASKGLLVQLASAAIRVFPITAGKTYAVYSADYNSSVFTIGVANSPDVFWQKATTVVTLTTTAVSGVKTFVAPTGMTHGFITVLLPSFSFDIRSSLWINEGAESTRNEKVTTNKVNNLYFRDDIAQDRIDNLEVSNYSRLKYKKWCVIGDSITAKNFRTIDNYHDFVARDAGGMTIYNYGISGTGYFNRSNVASLVTQTDIDIITVFLGTNDWGNQTNENKKQLGVFLDTGTTTISGCINTLLSALLTKFPTKRIAVITPTPRLTNWGSNAANNAYGYTLEQLSKLIIQYCQHYSLPCLDLYHESNLPVWIPAANDYYFTAPTLTESDGLHPNDAGHRVIADKVKSFLESI